MSKLFFTSDTHFGHGNIIDYSNRPFRMKKHNLVDVDRMNKVLVKNWNQRVKEGDEVIFLGDFCFKNTSGGKEGEGQQKKAEHYVKQLNGHITFVRGNHDSNNSLKTFITGLMVEVGGYKMWCCHDPEYYNPQFDINLVGHVHGSWRYKIEDDGTILINVGVDVWNYQPVSLNEILKIITQIKKNISKDMNK